VSTQLPLPISETLVPSFENFFHGDNALALDMVQRLRTSPDNNQLFFWGAHGCGKTHLLLAAHNDFVNTGVRSFYLSLKDSALRCGVLDSLDGYALIALDDIDTVAGDSDWEQSLFNLINAIRQRHGKIVFAANATPASGGWELADLVSRLNWGPVVKLNPLTEADIQQTLMMVVSNKGLEMSQETLDYLLNRHNRDVQSLLATVEVLDRESLAAGRASITIPFLKSCLGELER